MFIFDPLPFYNYACLFFFVCVCIVYFYLSALSLYFIFLLILFYDPLPFHNIAYQQYYMYFYALLFYHSFYQSISIYLSIFPSTPSDRDSLESVSVLSSRQCVHFCHSYFFDIFDTPSFQYLRCVRRRRTASTVFPSYFVLFCAA